MATRMKLRTVVCVLMSLALALPLLASPQARADSVVIEPPHPCRVAASDTAWSQDGKRTVAVALRALAALTCESYLVPRALSSRSVVFALGNERASAVILRERVARRLKDALGVELAQDTRLFRLTDVVAASRALSQGIQCSANRCELDRALLDQIWSDTDALARSVRIVPKIENDAPIGFQLFGVRPDGVVARFGFANGDVITHVNGIAIGSPDKALAAYATLRGSNEIVVEGRRRDGALRIVIAVRNGESAK